MARFYTLAHFVFTVLMLCGVFRSASVYAQNLVPNPSFELYNNCPASYSGIAQSPTYTSFPTVKDWVRPSAASSDYFNTCATVAGGVNVPATIFGYRTARTGNAFVGFYTYYGSMSNGPNYQENITAKLTSPLVKDSVYCVRFYASPAGISAVTSRPAVSCNEIGVHFSNTIPNTTGYTISLSYDVVSDTTRHMTDTSMWYEISGTYRAKGGEEWITIGTFNNGYVPSLTVLNSGTPPNPFYAYAFVDDVTVALLQHHDTVRYDTTCNAPQKVISSSSPTGSYLWNTGDTTRSITVTAAGIYTVEVNLGDCSILDEKIHVIVAPESDSSHTLYKCEPLNGDLVLESRAHGAAYTWSTGETTGSVHTKTTGDFVSTAYNNCHIYVDSFHVLDGRPQPPVVQDTEICQSTPLPQIAAVGENLLWYIVPGGGAGSIAQPPVNTANAGKTTLYLSTHNEHCESPRVPVVATIIALPQPHPIEKVARCTEVDNSQLLIGKPFADKSISYTWNTGQTGCCIVPGPDGIYTREAVNKCAAATDSFTVRTVNCERCVAFPDAFTPNADGRNDVFRPLVRCPLRTFRMRIFNRWGESVFVSYDQTLSWDGLQSGRPAPLGVYMYEATYEHEVTGKTTTVKGDVTLIR